MSHHGRIDKEHDNHGQLCKNGGHTQLCRQTELLPGRHVLLEANHLEQSVAIALARYIHDAKLVCYGLSCKHA